MLKLKDVVYNKYHNKVGVVIEAGPYGDAPFQVRAEDKVYSFIWEDGTHIGGSEEDVWEKVKDA